MYMFIHIVINDDSFTVFTVHYGCSQEEFQCHNSPVAWTAMSDIAVSEAPPCPHLGQSLSHNVGSY